MGSYSGPLLSLALFKRGLRNFGPLFLYGILEFPRRSPFLGVRITRIIVYWGLFWGPLFVETHIYLLGSVAIQ